eukprot:TRINITY_DN781_c0_g1_i4.p1 TRINITY_DN781_c0_g1~~TRINITY_DN781_c0_g1_i4.p1  ORF type:complete len:390 (-),score=98.65 TRINITY_DN781_c0_g1_i4:896-2065(-)
MSAVDFKMLCDLMPKKNRREGQGCGGMQNIDIQIEALHEFVNERDWIEIVTSPAELRSTVSRGKLGVVISIEVSDLFEGCLVNCTWREQLNKYYDLGVRSIQLVHQTNNQFGGSAFHHWMFKLYQLMDIKYNLTMDDHGRNTLGLTDLGKEVMQAMIDMKMFVDLAHLSERAVEDTFDIVFRNRYYPVIVSHGFLRSMGYPDKQKETKTTPDWALRALRRTCGMFGIRTDYFEVQTYDKSGVPNDCDGSSKSFAQSYQYASLGLNISLALGTDFNGFIQQTRPRFGNKKETCAAKGDNAIRDQQQALQTDRLGTDFDTRGLGHIGLVPDLLQELRNFKVDTSNIDNSAENFAQLWERMYNDEIRFECGQYGFNPIDPTSTSPSGRYTAR